MIGRSNKQTFIGKHLPHKKLPIKNRPFWLPASNFYILAVAFTVAVFFITWAILNAGQEEMPLLSAGLLASAILAGAVVLREVIIRSARYRILLAQQRIDRNIRNPRRNINLQSPDKLTIEENIRILKEIEKQSNAADNLGKLPENHWKVFEICHEYLHRNERELESVNFGSPRIKVLRESREKVQKLHKRHLLRWASLESRALIQEAKIGGLISNKLENANKALMILDSAREFYPDEKELSESAEAVKDFTATIKVSHWIEQAERAGFKKNYKRALSHYRDALFYLARENVKTEEREQIAERINSEIEKLRTLQGGIKLS